MNSDIGRNNNIKKNIIIYTAITGGKDILKEDQIIDGADFVCFTDNPDLKSKTWKILPACNLFHDANRNSKIHKILAHKYFGDYTYSVWIDGALSLKVPVESLIDKYLSDTDIALYRHQIGRNCIYKEAEACITLKLNNIDIMKEQVKHYKDLGYPSDFGLYECPVILRRNTPEIEELNNFWWAEICRYSRRDQLSFDYILWKLGIRVTTIPGHIKDGIYFNRIPHRY